MTSNSYINSLTESNVSYKKFKMKIFLAVAFVFVISNEAAKYEIIFDRLETAFGEKDKVFRFDTLRVTKFNRTT